MSPRRKTDARDNDGRPGRDRPGGDRRRLDRRRIHEQARLFVVGHPEILRRAARLLDRDVTVVEIESPESLQTVRDRAPIRFRASSVWRRSARCAARSSRCASRRSGVSSGSRCRRHGASKQIDGIVTAPLSKAALHAAGHHYPGHTELLAEMCGVRLRDDAVPGQGAAGAGSRVERESGERRVYVDSPEPCPAPVRMLSASCTSRCTNRCAACSPI